MINVHGNGEHAGYKVETWDDVMDDNIKTETVVTSPGGVITGLDISPYIWGEERVRVIEAVIDAGLPRRWDVGTYGAFRDEDIEAIRAYGNKLKPADFVGIPTKIA